MRLNINWLGRPGLPVAAAAEDANEQEQRRLPVSDAVTVSAACAPGAMAVCSAVGCRDAAVSCLPLLLLLLLLLLP